MKMVDSVKDAELKTLMSIQHPRRKKVLAFCQWSDKARVSDMAMLVVKYSQIRWNKVTRVGKA